MSATTRVCAAALALLLTVLVVQPPASAAPPTFTHPGVLVSRPQLDFIRTQVNANLGCTDERQDAIAAYTLALMWYITQDSRYATKAISIMDAWSATIRDHTNSNAPLQTAWSASSWTRAAEIVRYTYSSWPNVTRFATMLRSVYLPEIVNGAASMNGNWELVMMESTLGVGQRYRHQPGDHQLLARADHVLRGPVAGNLPRLHPHR